MNRNLILFSVLAIALSGFSFGLGVVLTSKPVPLLSDGKQLVASIKGKDYTAEDLYAELKKAGGTTTLISNIDQFIAEKEIETTEEILNSAKNQLARYKNSVVSQGGNWESQLAEWGFANEQGLIDYLVRDLKKNEIITNYFEKLVTDKQINAYYETDIFGKMTSRHILIKPEVSQSATEAEKTEAKNKAKEKALSVIEKLKNGEKWEDLVKEYSEDTGTKDNNGELSFSKKDVVEPFWDASVKLKDGEYTTTPVESTFGFHIIYRVKQEAKPKLEDVRQEIITSLADLEKAKENAVELAWIKIRENYEMKIFDFEIKELYNQKISTIK